MIAEQQQALEELTDEDSVPELPQEPVIRTGELWHLGVHRLLVGDATSTADVRPLLADEAADLAFTDPQYNVVYEGYTEDKLKLQGDRMTSDQFQEFLAAAFSSYRSALKPGASLYICHSSSWQREFQDG